jgi:hypothetical protein
MDIVGRLRACDCGVHCKSGCIQQKAADEIERLLEAGKELIVEAQENLTKGYDESADEIKRLRAALEKYADDNYNGYNGNGDYARRILKQYYAPDEATAEEERLAMLWEPKPDITLYELAEALGVLLPAIGGATSETVKDAVNSLSPNVRRHFRDEEME